MAEMHKPLLLLALLAAHLGISCPAPVRMQLSRPDAARGLTGREMLQRMALCSKARAARRFLSASAQVVPGNKGEHPEMEEYLVKLVVGTPQQPVALELDTGSDLIWTQCGSCPSCFDQALPYFQPSLSSTSSGLPCFSSACPDLPLSSCGTRNSSWGNQACVYTGHYGDKSVATGVLGVDASTFASAVVVPNVTVGCGMFNNGNFMSNETAIAGLGSGPLSLPC